MTTFLTKVHNFLFGPPPHEASIPLATAYTCVACGNCQNGAPHGRCKRCQSPGVVPLDVRNREHAEAAYEQAQRQSTEQHHGRCSQSGLWTPIQPCT
jgi:hypothetical protein